MISQILTCFFVCDGLFTYHYQQTVPLERQLEIGHLSDTFGTQFCNGDYVYFKEYFGFWWARSGNNTLTFYLNLYLWLMFWLAVMSFTIVFVIPNTVFGTSGGSDPDFYIFNSFILACLFYLNLILQYPYF